eukprot:CAMPEP_0202706132 /NCGR_PEP_ID=MMETSP1385-20130828/18598_1 /ASSEMBLY_ACC=CAM_ASM_000861 /TAXON_ID=933848 /ORGANISM="Elphidium margaritaceum" /LENGTH=610 /DNA_ID=CAMNT_0049364533 /DNA_START=7 /DNA_END=1839 /DNA_ORIENTATION=-
MIAWDKQYVKFDDIDGMGQPSYRYWKDVFLITSFDDAKYPALKVGDSCFALFQNVGGDFTTVYYKAAIRQLPRRTTGTQSPPVVVVDFMDGTDQYLNIAIPASANIECKEAKDGVITVPTVIHRMCAENTSAHAAAIAEFERSTGHRHKHSNKHSPTSASKTNKPKTKSSSHHAHKSAHKPPVPPPPVPPPAVSTAAAVAHTQTLPPPKPALSTRTPSQSVTPLKKPLSARSLKRLMNNKNDSSDSDSPIVSAAPTKVKLGQPNQSAANINIGVALHHTRTSHPPSQGQPPLPTAQVPPRSRKRKHDLIDAATSTTTNANANPINPSASMSRDLPLSAQPPPLKKHRSNRRGAQRLKLPSQPTTSTASTSTSHPPLPPPQPQPQPLRQAQSVSHHPPPPPPPPVSVPAQAIPPSKAAKKRTIKLKKKKNTASPAVSSAHSGGNLTPVLHAGTTLPTVRASSSLQRPPTTMPPSAPVDIKQIKQAQQAPLLPSMNKRIIPSAAAATPTQTDLQQQFGKKRKLRKMWGEQYDVVMPSIANDAHSLFDNDLYLNDFAKHLQEMMLESCQTNEEANEHFMSGLGLQHKWNEPREIGELAVGPYVVEIGLHQIPN